MIKYITENDKNGKARFYKVIDGKKKVTSRVEYEAHKDDVEEDIPEVDTTTTSVKVEEYAQFTLEDVNAADADTETCCEAENVIDFKSAGVCQINCVNAIPGKIFVESKNVENCIEETSKYGMLKELRRRG